MLDSTGRCFAPTSSGDLTVSKPSTSAVPRAVTGSRRRPFVTRAGRKLDFTSLGFGSAPLGNYLRPLSEYDCDATVNTAWDLGMRYFDTAPFYGLSLSELRVGRMLRSRRREDFVFRRRSAACSTPCARQVNGLGFCRNAAVTGRVRLFVRRRDALLRGEPASGSASIVSTSSTFTTSTRWCMAVAKRPKRASANCSTRAAGARSTNCAQRVVSRDRRRRQRMGALRTVCSSSRTPTCSCLRAATRCSNRHRSTHCFRSASPAWCPRRRRRSLQFRDPGRRHDVELRQGACRSHRAGQGPRRECRAFGVELPAAALQFILAHPVIVCVIPGGQNIKETLHNAAVLDVKIPLRFGSR